MAVYLALRLIIIFGTGYRVVKVEQASSGQPSFGDLAEWFYHRLRDETDPDATIEAEMSEMAGRVVSVATYSDPFELRKVQMIWSVADAAVSQEDARVCTFHLIKAPGGVASSDWVAADFTAMMSALDYFWTALAPLYPQEVMWDRVKVYRDGPAIVPPQVPVFDQDKNVSGTDGANPLPPQVAISVTEIAGVKRHWGRFYLPNATVSILTGYGRMSGTAQTTIATAVDALYTAWVAAGLVPVVYRKALPERETKSGATLPARAASAWSVEKVQVDDVLDVIRRRRFKYPTLRVQRDI